MLIYKEWAVVEYGKITKAYKMLLLFGIIPLWVSIHG